MAENRIAAGGGVVPHLMIPDGRAAEAIDFYKAAFGADEIERNEGPGGRLMHAHLVVNGGPLLLHDDFPEMHGGEVAGPPSGTTLHLEVDDADTAWRRAVAAGCGVWFALADQFWGARYGQVTDPFGHRWSIGATPKPPSPARP